ncbi:hypothetical protein ACFV09_40445, partial [Streptomyces sp. NPDC059631]
AHTGEHLHLGNSLDTDLGDLGRTGDHTPTTPVIHAGGDHLPTVHAGADHVPGGHTPEHTPSGHTGDHAPGGNAHEHGTGPTASHESPRNESGGHHTDGHSGGSEGAHGHEASQEGLGATHHDGPAGGAVGETPATGQGSAGGEGHGGPGHGHEQSGANYTEGDERACTPTGRIQLDQEAAVVEQLAHAKMSPQDIERSLAGLRKSEYGAGIAKYISEGSLTDLPGYDDLLSQCKQVSRNSDMTPAVYMAMEHAVDLQSCGVKGLAFEWKVPEEGLDLDVLVKSGDRIEYGVQLKDVQSAAGLNSATKGIAAKQLRGAIDGQKMAILDVHDTKAALTGQMLERIAARAKMTEATFVLRFEDGSITVPANGPTYP